jgi:SAM-dependent methyltransferase
MSLYKALGKRRIFMYNETPDDIFIYLLKKIWQLIPTSVQRIIWKNVFLKKSFDSFKYKNDSNVFTSIYKDNTWGSNETRSGGGSHINSTKIIREKLPALWQQFEIKSFLDVPCGDYNWMKEVDKHNIIYIGGDIVSEMIEKNNQKYREENVSFEVIDITNDILPRVDMIFCKDCLQHLSDENTFKALRNFKKSGSKYLLTTSYPLTLSNWDILDGQYRPLNLKIKPYRFPAPLVKIHENSKGYQMEKDKYMYLYKLVDIKI